jgi:uncharacterized protein involved in exopolysaccharide biosynthesis
MTARLRIDDAFIARLHYEKTVYKTIAILWSRRWLIASVLLIVLMLDAVALVATGPRYTGEAILQVSFTREETASGPKNQSTAALDAGTVVDSVARLVRARAVASAAVDQLALDQDPNFTSGSLPRRILSSVRVKLGLEEPVSSKHDLAVARLMRQVNVTSDPRSYLISVSVTSSDPVRSAKLANTVVYEYMRKQLLQQVSDAYASAEREMMQVSVAYGRRHPAYLSSRTRLEALGARLDELRHRTPDGELARLVVGQTFWPAEPVFVPSGPNIIIVVGVSTAAALGGAIWLALLMGFPRTRESFYAASAVSSVDAAE